MQKNDRRAVDRTGFGVTDTKSAGIDLLERPERSVRARSDRMQFCLARLRDRKTSHAELGSSNGRRRSAEKSATMIVDIFRRLNRIHVSLRVSMVGLELATRARCPTICRWSLPVRREQPPRWTTQKSPTRRSSVAAHIRCTAGTSLTCGDGTAESILRWCRRYLRITSGRRRAWCARRLLLFRWLGVAI